MIRFLRQNAEIITSICVVLSLLIGGSFLYMSQQAQEAGQAELDAITAASPAPATTPASAPASTAAVSASAVAETPQP
jgi:hypothetical protein